jgi:hypothetical protein
MTAASEIRHFRSWSDVPPGVYLTKTQLAQLDLPRRPAAPAAWVDGYDFRDKKTAIDLYRVDESVPSPATGRALTAARARTNGPDPRQCTHCGAHPELPCSVYQDGDRLCRACAHSRSLQAVQRESAGRRGQAAARAAELLADDRTVLVHVDLTQRGTTPSGARRSPSAARAVVLDTTGRQLADITVRLVGPRSAGIPDGALAPDDAAPPLRQALTGRRLVRWGHDDLAPLRHTLIRAGWSEIFPTGYGNDYDLWTLTANWRADIDHRTRSPRTVTPPGRADRMLYLLQQIAAGAADPQRT